MNTDVFAKGGAARVKPPEIPTGSGTISAEISESSQWHLRQAGRCASVRLQVCFWNTVAAQMVKALFVTRKQRKLLTTAQSVCLSALGEKRFFEVIAYALDDRF